MKTLRFLLACVCALPVLDAQGGIRWADPLDRPVLSVRRVGFDVYELCFSGWSTVAPTGPANGDNAATAVGLPPLARTVSSQTAKFVDDGSGNEAQSALFPFVPDARVVPIFQPADPSLDWFGFLAPVSTPAPARRPGTLCFHVQLSLPIPPAALLPMLAQAKVGVARTDANGSFVGDRFVRDPLRVEPADIVDLRFDRGAGTFAINHAGIAGGAPSTASVTATASDAWTPAGRFGAALRGGDGICDTGWSGGLRGSFTLAWACRQRAPLGGESEFAALGPFRCYTGGAAGSGVRCEGWGGGALQLNHDIQALAASGWVHVALVVDAEAGMATWYVNGIARQAGAIGTDANLPAGPATLRMGTRAPGGAGDYDLDDVRLRGAAASAAQIAGLATSSPASSTLLGVACGLALRDQNGPPARGNANYGLRIEGPPGANAALMYGLGTRLGAVDLPFDLGLILPQLAGCPWYSSILISQPVVIPAAGIARVQFPIPADPAWAQLEVYVQALAIDAQLAPHASQPLVLSIE
jgi:hypothetical protein